MCRDYPVVLQISRARKLGLPEIDALILATAVVNGFSEFYTFDGDFEGLDGKRVGATLVRYLH